MSIKPSASADVRQLIQALGAGDDVACEAAIARLAVIGARAIDHLLQEFPLAPGRARGGMLRAFEASADPRTLPAARTALQDSSAFVQTAAIGAIRALLAASKPEAAREPLDALVAVAVDRSRIAAVRIAAFDALAEVAPDARDAVQSALASDPDPDVRARPGGRGAPRRDRCVAGRRRWTPATNSRRAEDTPCRRQGQSSTDRVAAPRRSPARARTAGHGSRSPRRVARPSRRRTPGTRRPE